jgi:hypothetical protein
MTFGVFGSLWGLFLQTALPIKKIIIRQTIVHHPKNIIRFYSKGLMYQ